MQRSHARDLRAALWVAPHASIPHAVADDEVHGVLPSVGEKVTLRVSPPQHPVGWFIAIGPCCALRITFTYIIGAGVAAQAPDHHPHNTPLTTSTTPVRTVRFGIVATMPNHKLTVPILIFHCCKLYRYAGLEHLVVNARRVGDASAAPIRWYVSVVEEEL